MGCKAEGNDDGQGTTDSWSRTIIHGPLRTRTGVLPRNIAGNTGGYAVLFDIGPSFVWLPRESRCIQRSAPAAPAANGLYLIHAEEGVELERPHDVGRAQGAVVADRRPEDALHRRDSRCKLRHGCKYSLDVAGVVQQRLTTGKSKSGIPGYFCTFQVNTSENSNKRGTPL